MLHMMARQLLVIKPLVIDKRTMKDIILLFTLQIIGMRNLPQMFSEAL